MLVSGVNSRNRISGHLAAYNEKNSSSHVEPRFDLLVISHLLGTILWASSRNSYLALFPGVVTPNTQTLLLVEQLMFL